MEEGDEVKHIRTTYVVMAAAPPPSPPPAAAVHRCTMCATLLPISWMCVIAHTHAAAKTISATTIWKIYCWWWSIYNTYAMHNSEDNLYQYRCCLSPFSLQHFKNHSVHGMLVQNIVCECVLHKYSGSSKKNSLKFSYPYKNRKLFNLNETAPCTRNIHFVQWISFVHAHTLCVPPKRFDESNRIEIAERSNDGDNIYGAIL